MTTFFWSSPRVTSGTFLKTSLPPRAYPPQGRREYGTISLAVADFGGFRSGECAWIKEIIVFVEMIAIIWIFYSSFDKIKPALIVCQSPSHR